MEWLVLFLAACHAAVHSFIKVDKNKEMVQFLMGVGSSLLIVPFLDLDVLWQIPVSFLLPSLLLHCLGQIFLVNSYKHGDLSLAYPLIRGLSPLAVLLVSFYVSPFEITAWVVIGIFMISLGVLFLSARHSGIRDYPIKCLVFSMLTSLIIGLYTNFDAAMIRLVENKFGFLAWFFFLDGWLYALYIVFARSVRTVISIPRKTLRNGIVAAVVSVMNYGVSLWAMNSHSAAKISSLRESSLLFSVLIGFVVLKESVGWKRWLGTGLMVLGIVFLV